MKFRSSSFWLSLARLCLVHVGLGCCCFFFGFPSSICFLSCFLLPFAQGGQLPAEVEVEILSVCFMNVTYIGLNPLAGSHLQDFSSAAESLVSIWLEFLSGSLKAEDISPVLILLLCSSKAFAAGHSSYKKTACLVVRGCAQARGVWGALGRRQRPVLRTGH